MTNGQQTIEEIANTMYEPPTLTEITVSTQSVRDKVNTLKINKFTGPYDTPQKLLRLAGNATVSYLVWLYRSSIEYKTVFSGWKTAKLTPIHKKKTMNVETTVRFLCFKSQYFVRLSTTTK